MHHVQPPQPEQISAALNYIKNYWPTVTYHHPEDHLRHVGLPNPFVAANEGIFARDQFYWDSYFTILGLLEQDQLELAKGMVDNALYLVDRFGMVPMRNRFFNTGGSQPPFLSSMVEAIFEVTQDKDWLKQAIPKLEQEYAEYWLSDQSVAEYHQVYHGLSRYADHTVSHLGAEHESGWDVTSRFRDHALDYAPVDLNSLLYVYERNFAKWYQLLDQAEPAELYAAKADNRQELMQILFWSQAEEFFFDYLYQDEVLDTFYSLAGFYPLWAELASPEQAAACRDKLLVFEYQGGLATTQSTELSMDERRQWDYPNGWANLQWIVIKGLLNYGYRDDAKRLADKWLHLNLALFEETGTFWEKYNVVLTDYSQSCRYPTQKGFSWSCAVFVKLVKEFYPEILN